MRMYSSSDRVPELSGSCRDIMAASTGGSSRKPEERGQRAAGRGRSEVAAA